MADRRVDEDAERVDDPMPDGGGRSLSIENTAIALIVIYLFVIAVWVGIAQRRGVNLALADGSVKFVKDSIGLQPWWALGTRSSGEVLSADQY